MIQRAIRGGYSLPTALTNDPWLETIRHTAAFEEVVVTARENCRKARQVFEASEGSTLLQ